MSTSSVVIESNEISKHKHIQDHSVVVPAKLPIKGKKFEAIKIRLYRHFIETMKSSVAVFAALAIYKISGIHAWWIQVVQNMLSRP
ncbi:MAG: hypothetical protein HZC49_10355 [Nitrospirae bacterium]|nr:hypothetical protein [Nitrospirota bacterium]